MLGLQHILFQIMDKRFQKSFYILKVKLVVGEVLFILCFVFYSHNLVTCKRQYAALLSHYIRLETIVNIM